MSKFKGVEVKAEQYEAMMDYVMANEYFTMMQSWDEVIYNRDELGDDWINNRESLIPFVKDGKVTLYRGVPNCATMSSVLGASWTVDKHVAKWHALNINGGDGGRIFELTFDIEDILPHLIYADCHGYEAEVLLNKNELFPYCDEQYDDRWCDVIIEELEQPDESIGSMEDWNYEEGGKFYTE